MSTQKTVVLKAPRGFQPGHPRWTGRKKRNIAEVRALAAELGVDPMTYLLNLLAVDATEEIEFDADGTERRVKVPVTRDLKISIAQSLLNFFSPKLSSTQVTGKDEGPVEVATVDINELMKDPKMVEYAQALSLGISSRQALPAPLPHFAHNNIPE